MWRPLPLDQCGVGERLKRIAYGKGWNSKQLAAAMEITPPRMCNILKGSVPVSQRTLERLVKILDCETSLPYLIEAAKREGKFVVGRRRTIK